MEAESQSGRQSIRKKDRHTYIHTCMHTYIHTYIHTYKGTHTQRHRQTHEPDCSATRASHDFCNKRRFTSTNHRSPSYCTEMHISLSVAGRAAHCCCFRQGRTSHLFASYSYTFFRFLGHPRVLRNHVRRSISSTDRRRFRRQRRPVGGRAQKPAEEDHCSRQEGDDCQEEQRCCLSQEEDAGRSSEIQ